MSPNDHGSNFWFLSHKVVGGRRLGYSVGVIFPFSDIHLQLSTTHLVTLPSEIATVPCADFLSHESELEEYRMKLEIVHVIGLLAFLAGSFFLNLISSTTRMMGTRSHSKNKGVPIKSSRLSESDIPIPLKFDSQQTEDNSPSTSPSMSRQHHCLNTFSKLSCPSTFSSSRSPISSRGMLYSDVHVYDLTNKRTFDQCFKSNSKDKHDANDIEMVYQNFRNATSNLMSIRKAQIQSRKQAMKPGDNFGSEYGQQNIVLSNYNLNRIHPITIQPDRRTGARGMVLRELETSAIFDQEIHNKAGTAKKAKMLVTGTKNGKQMFTKLLDLMEAARTFRFNQIEVDNVQFRLLHKQDLNTPPPAIVINQVTICATKPAAAIAYDQKLKLRENRKELNSLNIPAAGRDEL
ncbi:hypothetical protein BKA69DRAFT_1124102 [Paraphysoderma sedebokerense]|nr:hypothetical protein BKA69DRAFT_1124102 [Paraphysoderma sedebokerense]